MIHNSGRLQQRLERRAVAFVHAAAVYFKLAIQPPNIPFSLTAAALRNNCAGLAVFLATRDVNLRQIHNVKHAALMLTGGGGEGRKFDPEDYVVRARASLTRSILRAPYASLTITYTAVPQRPLILCGCEYDVTHAIFTEKLVVQAVTSPRKGSGKKICMCYCSFLFRRLAKLF